MANSMVAEEIALENKEKMSNGGKVRVFSKWRTV